MGTLSKSAPEGVFSRFILHYYKQNARDSGAIGFDGFAIGYAGVANGFAGIANGFEGVANGFEGVANGFEGVANGFAKVTNDFAGVVNGFVCVAIGNVYCTFSNLCSVIEKVRNANARQRGIQALTQIPFHPVLLCLSFLLKGLRLRLIYSFSFDMYFWLCSHCCGQMLQTCLQQAGVR